uniref:Protein-tyrosine-phosphatase n=1 Tax=Gouania willdenowi TaxID=441366 RepID=A0A8C5DTE2_GOUWI
MSILHGWALSPHDCSSMFMSVFNHLQLQWGSPVSETFILGPMVSLFPAAPGLVTNLTAYAENHTSVMVTWYLPHRINGLITKFAVTAKHARTSQIIRTLEVNAEDIMTGALPHCNGYSCPLEITASSPPITLTAVPPAAAWSVPISVAVDQLRPYTAYLFEVSGFTSDGEGQIASTMVRMPESAPEDPPQNFVVMNMTSRSISFTWNSPNIVTGKFTYVLYLYGPTGFLYDNSTADTRFAFTALNPYTRYRIAVRAKAAGEVGPAVEEAVITPAEAPSAVQDLAAVAEDSVSIRVSWRIPAQPNGPIIQYRLQVLVDDSLMQDITLTTEVDTQISYTQNHSYSFLSAAGVTVRQDVVDYLSEDTVSYLVYDLHPFTEYTFRVTASTTVGEGPAKDINEKTREQVPSSVLNVAYQNISSTSILLSWIPPLNPNGRITHYTVYGVNMHNNEALQWTANSTNILITDLEKHAGYKLQVAASTAAGESLLSEEDDIIVFTLEDEPESPPKDLAVEDLSPTSVTLMWSVPEKANGVILVYEVLYENETHSAVVNTTSNTITLVNLKPFSYYNVFVRAFTRYGHGNQTSDVFQLLSGEDGVDKIHIQIVLCDMENILYHDIMSLSPLSGFYLFLFNANDVISQVSEILHSSSFFFFLFPHTSAPDTPPQYLYARKLSDYEVELSWEPPREANSEILYYSVRIWYASPTLPLLPCDKYSESTYNASVSSWTRLGDGGVLIYISFSTIEAEPSDPPQDINVVNMTTSSITLTWRTPNEPNGIIVYYSIYYSENQTLLPESPPVYTLVHLVGGTNYTLWMTSSTRQGDGGVQSEPITLVLPEDVPSDSVRNLTAQIFSSTAIIISWDPPLEPNGRPYYLLTLQEAGIHAEHPSNQGTPAINKTIKHTTTDNVFLFTKLRKYFPYVLTVTPATGAGPAYNHTSTMHLRTDDDSELTHINVSNLSSSSIDVAWQRPLEPNGEIMEYTLTLFGPGGSDTTVTINTSTVLTDLLPYTPYNLSITAATRKGSGPHLMLQLHTDEGGPESPPRNVTIFNHTAFSVWLNWEPPLEPNGVVIKYGFQIRDLVTHTVTHQNSSGASTMEHLSGFRPHSSYEISVYSYTRVGHGNHFSTPVTFTTNESVSDAVGNLSCSGMSWDSVQLLWDLPANPNGQILFYEVVLENDQQQPLTEQTYSEEFTVTGLLPDQEYTFTVTVVNAAGPGHGANCTAFTLSESVPAAPRLFIVSQVTPNNVTLEWVPPLSVPGLLREYHIIAQLLSTVCESNIPISAQQSPEEDVGPECVDHTIPVSVNASDSTEEQSLTISSLDKYRYYRFKVAAVTNAGTGEYTQWNYARTLAGKPDAPPRSLKVISTSNSLHITWELPVVLSGPTSYLIQVTSSTHLCPKHVKSTCVVVTNLTAFTRYFVTITAFTGSLELAEADGKAVGPIVFQTLEEEPKDPPKNVNVSVIPEEVNVVRVTFNPPEEPNGNITAYYVYVYEKDWLVKNISLNVIKTKHDTLTAVIDGLKGGHTYNIQISAKNGAGRSPPSPHVEITTGIKAPAKPTLRPQAMLSHGGVAMVTHRTITIRMPACFYSDDNGPITKIQVIVSESGVKDMENLTNWKSAFSHHPAPYLTDAGFPNPPCLLRDIVRAVPSYSTPPIKHSTRDAYVIGNDNNCLGENATDHFCNGPLKANTVYVFKFRATNINGQYTDSEYSDHIRTAGILNGLLTRKQKILLGVLLSLFLAAFHQRKKEGGTYSPREAEIIETKCKLDQLIAVADLELKQEKLNRLLSYRKSLKPVNKKSFLQHVEDLCANDNAKFQEEFSELPKLLQDLATSDADLPWNKSKNRFPNIKPYNNNRVKLLSEPGTVGSDYINASFVSGYLCPNEFIATQGPLPGTVADFWRMIWETGTHTIAMLTQCYEKGRIRCHKYWPEDNKPMSVFSDILISKVSEEVLPDWTVRTLKVEKHGHYILVRHFNYTSWPEHGVPESCSTLIKFVRAVRAHRHDNNTIVVHCSAGVGRTGVFIAIDHLIQHVRDHDFVDVYGLVAELRSERMCMVQNLAQYIFLHQSTLELLNNKGNSQSIWFVSYSALEKMDSLDAMEVSEGWTETVDLPVDLGSYTHI